MARALWSSPSWNLAAPDACSPLWNLVALVCNPLCAAFMQHPIMQRMHYLYLRNAALSCSPSWNRAALFCSPSWNLVALVCNPLCAESESCSTLAFNACTTSLRHYGMSFISGVRGRQFRPFPADFGGSRGGSGPVLKIYVLIGWCTPPRARLFRPVIWRGGDVGSRGMADSSGRGLIGG